MGGEKKLPGGEGTGSLETDLDIVTRLFCPAFLPSTKKAGQKSMGTRLVSLPLSFEL